MEAYKKLVREFGEYKHEDGKIYTLTQFPYADTDFSNGVKSVYFANAIDDEENEYELKWDIINDECEDESEACDWDDFEVRYLGKI